MPKLIFIVGQTAVGKTELALRLGESLSGKILSCDSLCFYEGMDIGTAKPTSEERARVPHYGVDLVPVDRPYSIGDYFDYSTHLLSSLERTDESLIVVGGSGFYLKSFFEPVMDEIEVSEAILSMVQRWHREGGLEAWLRKLRELNPDDPLEIDVQNPRRVGQALIRCLSSGKSLKQLRERFEALPKPFQNWEKKVFLLKRDSDEMKIRNQKRVHQMLDAGLVEEVNNLLRLGIERNPSAAKAIGYRETIQYIRGELSYDELIEQIQNHTNQLMRKQRTWFRSQLKVDLEINPEEASKKSVDFFNSF